MISVGAQPNSAPHFGTLVVFCLAFSLGRMLNELNREATVLFEVVDTAPQSTVRINGIEYQKSLRYTRTSQENMVLFEHLLRSLSHFSKVTYKIRDQHQFNSQSTIREILYKVLYEKKKIANILDPEYSTLRLRIPCPKCGMADKKGITNEIKHFHVKSICPDHGEYLTPINETDRFEYNTPLRNLIRGLVYLTDNHNPDIDFDWIRITGSDYAGFYQEQLFYKLILTNNILESMGMYCCFR